MVKVIAPSSLEREPPQISQTYKTLFSFVTSAVSIPFNWLALNDIASSSSKYTGAFKGHCTLAVTGVPNPLESSLKGRVLKIVSDSGLAIKLKNTFFGVSVENVCQEKGIDFATIPFEKVRPGVRLTAGREVSDDVFVAASYDVLKGKQDFSIFVTGNVRDEAACFLAQVDPLMRSANLKVVLSSPVVRQPLGTGTPAPGLPCGLRNTFFLEHSATLRDPFKRTILGCSLELGSKLDGIARGLADHYNRNMLKYLWRVPFKLGYGLYHRHQLYAMGSPTFGSNGLFLDLSHNFDGYKPTVGLRKAFKYASLGAKYDFAEDELELKYGRSGVSLVATSKGTASGPRRPSLQLQVRPLLAL